MTPETIHRKFVALLPIGVTKVKGDDIITLGYLIDGLGQGVDVYMSSLQDRGLMTLVEDVIKRDIRMSLRRRKGPRYGL